ncbi:MAG: hypothetical protein C0505_15940 [Leptothrix sp. (in: Bacteria)]|nr:hypothetical protein [Leptothrix sp. (in: b-proteobacteria)]
MQELPSTMTRPGERRARDLLALLLLMASRALGLLAERVAMRPQPPGAEPVIEFHGDASAPEGALYVDGKLVGHVLGVNRL